MRRFYGVGGGSPGINRRRLRRADHLAVASGGGANKMSAAIGGVTETFNHYPDLRRHDEII